MSIKFKDTDIDNISVDKVYYKDEQIYPVEVKTWESGVQNFDTTTTYTLDQPFEMEFTDLPNNIKPTSTMTLNIQAPNSHYGIYNLQLWLYLYNNDTGSYKGVVVYNLAKGNSTTSLTYKKAIQNIDWYSANFLGSDSRKIKISFRVSRTYPLSNSGYWGAGTFSIKIDF